MVGLSGMGCKHSHSRETLTGHGRLDSGARLQRKAARTALSVAAAPSFRRCYGIQFTTPGAGGSAVPLIKEAIAMARVFRAHICKAWEALQPERFKLNPLQQMPGPNI
ncbi:MAG: hypothetical protein EOR25_34000 [Mesorhizobium sp.]|nr:MAG: hypothetical protein EOR24_35290 [Mesorhizobium sp.]RWJ09762.1 MAG: hypothetical protein EOR25_34000 [Mesorhizobium sp.]RWJ74005.1 MAG: hypothetical protein EOR35_32090 [Mesorhizobium sp.]